MNRSVWILRVILLLQIWPKDSYSSETCPAACTCTTDFLVKCGGGRGSRPLLTTVPQDIPQNTQVLNLKDNAIESISALKPLRDLHTLVLSHNRIRTIPENFLDRFPSLTRLSLSHNKLVSVGPLSELGSALRTLELRHNKLTHISRDAFSSLPQLVSIDFSYNQIRSFPTSLKEQLPRLNVLRAHANPLNCDCRLLPLLKVLVSSAVTSKPHCASPFSKSLIKSRKRSFQCISASNILLENGSRQLQCPYGNNSLWMFRNADIEDSDPGSFKLLSDGSLIIPATDDVTLFSCSTETQPVVRRSRRQLRPVPSGSPPLFTFQLSDASFREGTPVKLHCEVNGIPRPLVAWRFKDQRIAPSRHHEFLNSGQVLRIYPFLEADAGRYSCEAKNIHGRVSASADIRIVSSVPPEIVDVPASRTVNLGEIVSFECRAIGSPKPVITWFFDGSEIPHLRGRFSVSELRENVMVSEDGSELRIRGVTKMEDGVFSCMAGNTVGAMTAEARLTVRARSSTERRKTENELTEEEIKTIVRIASANVNRAIYNTRTQLNQDGVRNVEDLKRLFRFAIPSQAIELNKAREIYEESIRLVQAHVQSGLNLNGLDLSSSNVSYESVLAVSHVQTIMELSGCQGGQFKDNSCRDTCFHSKYRSYDGQCNNLAHPMWGVSQWPLARLLPPIYENGFNTPVGWNKGQLYFGYPKPNAREVSRQLVSTRQVTPHQGLSSFVMQWGQVVDHDLTHTATPLSRNSFTSGAMCNRTCENLNPCFNIHLLPGDPKLHPQNRHHQKFPCIEFERSGAICGSGETSLLFQRVTYREQMNLITSYMDASFIYGSQEIDSLELRDHFGGQGMLRFDVLSAAGKPLLPFEKESPMDCRRNFSVDNPIRCFLAGDLRANEQVQLSSTVLGTSHNWALCLIKLGLTAVHTVFLREHNRLAKLLSALNPGWDGERLYQEARKLVGAFVQHITYTEWLPLVIGKSGVDRLIGPYKGYNSNVDATVSNVFATAAFRFGHTLINPVLRRLDENFESIPQGDLPLHEALFAPERLFTDGGIDPILRGLFATPLKTPQTNELLNSVLTEKLFHRGHDVALDLAAMNIQRGRDHGLPGYTEYRRWCNLPVPKTWKDVTTIVRSVDVVRKLKGLYGHPGNIDVWVGGITEERIDDGLVGPLFACIIGEQFKRLRDGDRFWYEEKGVFLPEQLEQIRRMSLARILCENADNITRVQTNVFSYPGRSSPDSYGSCEAIPSISLDAWTNCCENDCASSVTERPLRKRRQEISKKLLGEKGKESNPALDEIKESLKRRQPPTCVYDETALPEGLTLEKECVRCECKGGKTWCEAVCNWNKEKRRKQRERNEFRRLGYIVVPCDSCPVIRNNKNYN